MSLLAYHHARRRLAAGSEPPVLLRYSAAALTGLPTGADVATWPNTGTLGSQYDAQASAPGAATYYAAAGGAPAYLRAASPAYLATMLDVPAALTGNHSRTLLLCYYLETSSNTNLLGYGANDATQLSDVLAIDGVLLAPHFYGDSVVANGPPVGQITTLAIRMTTYSADAVTTDVLQDGALTKTRIHNLNTAASVLRLFAGMYPDFNNSVPKRLVAFAAFGAALTDTQIARQLLTLY